MLDQVRLFYDKPLRNKNEADIGGETLYAISFEELERIGQAARLCTEQVISDTIEGSDD